MTVSTISTFVPNIALLQLTRWQTTEMSSYSIVIVFALLGILNPSYRGGFVSFGLFLFVFSG
jgi:hypothetical protein